MSTRSSVGIALKSDLWNHLVVHHPDVVKWLDHDSDRRMDHPDGVFFHFDYYKWHLVGPSNWIGSKLYEAVKDREEDYLIQEACHDYPTLDSDGDAGSWVQNPWRLAKCLSVSLTFEETD